VSAVGISSVRAIGWATAGYALYSIVDAATKSLTAFYPVTWIVLINTVFSLIPITAAALIAEGRAGLRARRPGAQAARAALGLGAILLNTVAFSRLPLADAYALLFTGPLVIAGLSAVFLGERVDRGGWVTILVGFAAVLYMIGPGGGGVDATGALAAALGVMCFSASALIVRRYGREEGAFSFPFYGNLFTVAALSPWVLPDLAATPPEPGHLALGAATGLVLGAAQIIILGVFRAAPPSVTAPFQYSQLIWGTLLGFVVFGDVPGPRILIGGAVVIAAGIHLIRREAIKAASDRS